MANTRNAIVPALLILSWVCFAAVLDRVAIVVGDQVFTETELLEEIRIAQFLNGEPLDLGVGQRKAAAERLVDQSLIRREMEIGGYDQPAPGEADTVLANLRKERFPSETAYRAALAHYGITDETLKRHLLWQVTALRFTDLRFGAALSAGTTPGAASSRERSINPDDTAVDRQMAAWLQETRASTRIRFKKEAFQ